MTDADQELWGLLQRVADDQLDRVTAQRLEELLLADRRARQVYARFMLLDADLALQHLDVPAADLELSPATAEHNPSSISQAKVYLSQPSRRFRRVGAMAALLAVAVVVAAIFVAPRKRDVPQIQRLEGVVRVVSDNGTEVALVAKQDIPSGATVVTGEESIAVLQYRDGTLLRIRADSRLQISDRKQLFLAAGLLEADVAPQDAAAPMLIRTRHAEVEVLGTELRAATENGATRVELLTGRVDVVRLADGKSVQLKQGEYAVAGSEETQLAPRPLPRRIKSPVVEIRHPDDALAFSPAGDVLAGQRQVCEFELIILEFSATRI